MVDIEYETIKEDVISLVKAKDILSKAEEPNYDQKLALEHAKKFGKMKTPEVNKLIEELKKLDMRKLKDAQIVKIIDLLPADIDDLKIILQHAEVPFKDEELQPILDVLKKNTK
jgi:DNA-directed RNA polymerase subunit F